MSLLAKQLQEYENFCRVQKKLSLNTLRAYKIDMTQFLEFMIAEHPNIQSIQEISKEILKGYVEATVKKYASRTCKRKIACIKALFNHLEFEDVIAINPFRKIRVHIKEPKTLPKTMKKEEVEKQFKYLYRHLEEVKTENQSFQATRNIACYELLFSTGMRVGELCSLNTNSIDFDTGSVRIMGKGSKERIVYITSPDALTALKCYNEVRAKQEEASTSFFTGWAGGRWTEDSVRRMIRKTAMSTLQRRITPHMFRHTFATMLLENMVDIRFIQEILGHSSIKTTQIYLHLSNIAVRAALEKGHPRDKLELRAS